MSVVAYTRLMFIQRIRKHVNDGFPDDAYTTSDREIMLYIDQSVAVQIVGLAYANAKVEGTIAVAEGFLVTYNLTNILQDNNTGYWYATLPQPPISLPLGYSVTDAYFATPGSGKSDPILLIRTKRRSYRNFMPKPTGVSAWVENDTFWMEASNGYPLMGQNLFVQMPSARTDDLNALMNMPDDVLENVFNDVVMQLTKRYQEPKDIIHDDVPAGNNTVKS